ncbi:hypothetical protein [Xanthobacter tagetidis]|nr:hypothetical protein [Xanthobacter tagetidis]
MTAAACVAGRLLPRGGNRKFRIGVEAFLARQAVPLGGPMS